MTALLLQNGPQRLLAFATLAYSAGSGVFLTAGVLYFNQLIGIPVAQVGLGLSLAGLLSLAAGVMVGRLADARGARGVMALMLSVRGAATAGFIASTSFTGFAITVSLVMCAHSAGLAARSPLIRQHGGPRPQEFRAYLRSVTNVGISLGALAAGCATQFDSSFAYRVLTAGSALSYMVAATLIIMLPSARRVAAPQAAHRWCALHDGRYVTLALLDGVMALQFKVLTVGLPLWLILTGSPRWLTATAMIVNAVMVILFQVRASRGVTSPRSGGRAYRRAGLAFFSSCTIMSLVGEAPVWAATAGILCAALVHTVGELWHAAAGFEVSFTLAPDHASGQYLGVFGLGMGLADFVGPAFLVLLCTNLGRPGWCLLGSIFMLTGFAAPMLIRRAEAGRSWPGADGAPDSAQSPATGRSGSGLPGKPLDPSTELFSPVLQRPFTRLRRH
ncbi:MFS transporter [Actinocorallia aurea]